MPGSAALTQGQLYEQAAQFAAALETSQTAAVDQMLAAWTDSYWGIRQEMDAFLAKVATAQANGITPSPAWAYQHARLKNLLDTTKTQIARYAADASQVTEKAQKAAVAAALKHAQKLAGTAVAEQLPGLAADMAHVNPKALQHLVGHLADGSVLRNHLAATLPAEAAEKIRATLVHGLATGKSQDWMIRRATEGLAVSHSRATTILRTESLRAYRAASRAEYLANQDVIGTWVWNAHLDSRTCVACAIMDGTEHPLDAVLDGHPRCRCAMVPRTKSWDDLGVKGVADTRPPIRSGKAWLASQTPAVQRALMGRSKFDAWTSGTITLDDMVGRSFNPQWGTMRTERSLKAIMEDRNGNWFDAPGTPPQAAVKPPPNPQMKRAQTLADRYPLDYLEEWAELPGNSAQIIANVKAAIALKKARGQRPLGPSLPKPDPGKVQKALEKLAQAVLTKGYPSKGYSQTKAVWKAQANGTVGTKVGVVKSLTWEHKVTAQTILRQHDENLPALARQAEKKAAVAKAHDEALVIHAQKKADEAVEQYQKDLDTQFAQQNKKADVDAWWATQADDLADELKDAGDDVVAYQVAKAKQTHLAAKKEAYDQDVKTVQENWKNTEWTNPTLDMTLKVGDDGWGVFATKVADLDAKPGQLVKLLEDPAKAGWVQHFDVDPAQVAGWKKVWTHGDTGEVVPAHYAKAKESLDQVAPKDAVNLQEALDQDWVGGKWPPDPSEVDTFKSLLDDGTLSVDDLTAELSTTMAAKDKANLAQALKEWQAEQIAKAHVPVPKPAIQVNKIKWEKVSDTQVGKLVAKVQSGQSTVDDLYAAFQKSKNAGPKANYAKAILTLEGKADSIPGGPYKAVTGADPKDVQDWKDSLTTQADVDYLIEGAKAGDSAAQQAMIDLHKAGHLGDSWLEEAGLLAKGPDSTPSGLSTLAQDYLDAVSGGSLTVEHLVKTATTSKKAGHADAAKDALKHMHAQGKIGDVWLEKIGVKPPTPPTPKPDGPAWPTKPPWEPEHLKDTGKVLGTHGAKVYEAPDGTRWLFKPPKDPKDGFLATLDEAASRFQALAGLKAPDTFVVTLGGRRGSIQRMFDASDGFPNGFKPTSATKADLDVVQREHVLDWLLANHDGHRDQFLRLPNGTMVGIDKGQAFRWFGQDRLDWNFHPNAHYGAPEPVYNNLWRAFAQGQDVELDPPGSGALWDQIAAIRAIPDDVVRDMFRGYAEQAAARGLLAKPQKSFTGVDLKIPSNDVDAFLDALVARKNRLEDDFRDLYERAAKERAKAIPGWKPKAAKPTTKPGKAKWVGKEKPQPPTPPTEPKAATEALFADWVDAAAARLKAYNGKDLKTSHNWTRFRRVIEDLDETAAKELLDRHYLRPEDYQEALALIAKARTERDRLEAAYKKALAAHDDAMKGWKKDLADWKDANGIKDLTAGMDDAVIRHDTDLDGVRWANRHFSEDRYTPAQRSTLASYTGSSYRTWNSHLRDTGGKPTQHLDTFRKMDKAMEAQPIPEDVILHRGTGPEAFLLNGVRMNSSSDLKQLIGSVQVEHGYMSTSVGNTAAFSSMEVQLKIRTPAGTPGSYVQMFSHYGDKSGGAGGERELILGRGQRLYVHNAYKVNGKWFLEVEVVPEDFDPAAGTPSPSARPWNR